MIKTKKTRFKIAVISGIMLFALATLAVFKGMEGLATACVVNIMVILASYIFNETKRPSDVIKTN